MRQQAVTQAWEKTSMEGAREALRQSIARWTEQGTQLMTAIPGLSLYRRDAPTQPTSCMQEPSLCVIAQGVKLVLLGDDTYVLDVHHFLITSVDLPTMVQIITASREQPYLSLILKLDQREMAFVGGQVDKSSTGEPVHAFDLATQMAVVIRHVDTVLREFGAGLANVVKLVAFYATDGSVDETAFLTDIGRHVLAYGGAPDGGGPAVTLVPLPCLALPGMMVEIEASAMLDKDRERLPRTTANPPTLAPLPPPFSHGVRCGEHIWTSAQGKGLTALRRRSRASRAVDGRLQYPQDLAAQTDVAMEHVAQVLAALGADLDDTVKLGTWYRGDGTRATWEPAARKRAACFTVPGPTMSALPTPSLPPGDMARVDAWAMRGINGHRLARTYAQLHNAWQWPMALPTVIGLQCGDFVFVGQQVALDAQGQVIASGNLLEQTRRVMESTRTVLASFGLALDDMVKQNSFYQGQADPETIVTNQRYRSSFYNEPAGASTGVPLPCLPLGDLLVSVETVAMTRG
jgi:enamine deaminase RidA (YjgF/YER057c/UK114 family)